MVALTNGFINGIPTAGWASGQTFLPYGMTLQGNITTAADDRFYFPFFVDRTVTFSGARTWNGGAGDTGETLRLGVYSNNNGLPDVLLKDFGEITLTGATALRTLANAVTLPGPAWYWQCSAYSAASTMRGMTPLATVSSVGFMPVTPINMLTGFKLTTIPSITAGLNQSAGFYVSTAYGALPSTATAPTSELSPNTWAGGSEIYPMMGLYV